MREGGRLKKRERKIEREKGVETDVPKLYTYNEYEHSVIQIILTYKIIRIRQSSES